MDDTNDTQHSNTRQAWTIVHSHFAVMGGFAIGFNDPNSNYLPKNKARLILTPRALYELATKEPTTIPNLTEEEIRDKSKANGLAKTLVCLQALWFCAQCLSRLAQGLTISLLELNTFGHSICALIIYVQWWDKPLDVDEPMMVTTEASHQMCALLCMSSTVGRDVETDGGLSLGAWFEHLWSDSASLKLSDSDLQTGTTLFRDQQAYNFVLRAWTPEWAIAHAVSMEGLLHVSLPSFHLTPAYLRCLALASQGAITYGYDREGCQQLPVNTVVDRMNNWDTYGFARVKETTEASKDISWALGFTVAGLIYGGLHLIAWSAPFGSRAEQHLWRISAVTLTFSGILFPIWWVAGRVSNMADRLDRKDTRRTDYDEFTPASDPCLESSEGLRIDVTRLSGIRIPGDLQNNPFYLMGEPAFKMCRYVIAVIERRTETWTSSKVADSIQNWLAITMALLIVSFWSSLVGLYAMARIYLVVQCFVNLAHLPDSAYQLPYWSQYWPHVA